jgi:adenosylcobinamide kinase/adenosylcobinamide-phosphate guanylyltransferase
MLADRDIDTVINKLLVTIKNCPGEIILVSNEVGFGIVPENAMARRFRDFSGELHQKLALQAENVLLMVAGIPIVVKE